MSKYRMGRGLKSFLITVAILVTAVVVTIGLFWLGVTHPKVLIGLTLAVLFSIVFVFMWALVYEDTH